VIDRVRRLVDREVVIGADVLHDAGRRGRAAPGASPRAARDALAAAPGESSTETRCALDHLTGRRDGARAAGRARPLDRSLPSGRNRAGVGCDDRTLSAGSPSRARRRCAGDRAPGAPPHRHAAVTGSKAAQRPASRSPSRSRARGTDGLRRPRRRRRTRDRHRDHLDDMTTTLLRPSWTAGNAAVIRLRRPRPRATARTRPGSARPRRRPGMDRDGHAGSARRRSALGARERDCERGVSRRT